MSHSASIKKIAGISAQVPPSKARMGVLIPSPIMSHTHAVAIYPFDPNALLAVKNRLIYLPEHAITRYPLEQQAIHYAGQSVVVREMAKMRYCEVRERTFNRLPKVELNIYQNSKVKPIDDLTYWREMLGWAGSFDQNACMQQSRYTTLIPGQSQFLQGVQDKYEWDHGLGEWKPTTKSGIQETSERREWVCTELERIDSLRYDVMEDWKEKIEDKYVYRLKKKRKRAEEIPAEKSDIAEQREGSIDDDAAPTSSLKRHKTVSFDTNTDYSIEPATKKPRPSIEPPFEFPPLEIPGSQTTKSLFSEAFSGSPDADHEIRSQAPEPESPIKQDLPLSEDADADFIKRYSFVLEIPATDYQRLEWIKFLKTYQWNHSMIRSLKRFFLADKTPTISQTAEFLETLKAVCATIEEAQDSPGEVKRYRLLWDKKVDIHITPDFGCGSDSTTVCNPPTPTHLDLSSSILVSIRFQQQPAFHSGDPISPAITVSAQATDIQKVMKSYVLTLKKGDQVDPPCDRCRLENTVCRINKTSCKTCADAHHKCIWSKAVPGLMDGEIG